MPTYKAPLRDIRFVLHEVLDACATLTQLPGHEELDADTVDAVLEEGGRICEEVLLPLNQSGDREGCRLEDGKVRTPAGFREAYRTYVEGGWPSLACAADHGGQGLPETVAFVLEEMLCAANVSFSLYPGLTRGAYNALVAHASDELKAAYLPKMVEGRWSGTMCLTEAHAGTDLGLLRTKAEPDGEGRYRISGTKIFITGGEHDLTENIVHLVLARLPDAPAGVRGISLFLVPKFLPNPDGTPGARNGVSCGALEHKMGIKGSATCVMNFDGAVGWLVGEPHKGLACMFTMMNAERLAIGVQGLGLSEIAYQNAVAYARERVQGRAATGPAAPEQPADSILVHPDVRRMLLSVRAFNEGARAVSAWVALQLDLSESHPDPKARERADDLVALLTPVIKAYFSDAGFEGTVLCQQVFGGHGYIAEWGMEQYVRDARIAQIYEGTNGVQAMDLVRRKLGLHDGRLVKRYFAELDGCIQQHRKTPAMAPYLRPFAEAVKLLQETTLWLIDAAGKNPDEPGAAAVEYLRLFGLTTLAFLWVRMARVALDKAAGDDSGFYAAKLATARFFMERLLPQAQGIAAAVRAGAEPVMAFPQAAF